MAFRNAACSSESSLSRTRATGPAAPSSQAPMTSSWSGAMVTNVRRRSAGSGCRATYPARSRSAITPLTVGLLRPRTVASSPTLSGPPRNWCSTATCRGVSETGDSGAA
ncbi:MAG TPA: hypothetical protein VGG75_17015 [Trebonia sp.]|jgi:hypothetical protein